MIEESEANYDQTSAYITIRRV